MYSNTSLLKKMSSEWQQGSGPRVDNYGTLGTLSGDEAMTTIRQAGPQGADRMLHQAICEAADGNPVLERLLLQMFIGKIVKFTRSCRYLIHLKTTRSADEAFCVGIECFWEAIRKYPTHRKEHVAANLCLNALKIISRLDTEFDVTPYGNEYVGHTNPSPTLLETAPHETSNSCSGEELAEVMRVLQWSIDVESLANEEARLLGQYTVSTATEKHELAEALGLTVTSLSKKVYNIKTKLAKAISHHGIERGALV
ncbi:hypothetical protein ACTXMB_14525 [Arthrobacter rhombi]|uniref:hypothetical protein n=1 Tax=Arthrobacter rhombi TaxID=71253 RepID=UPI003FD17FCF